MNNPENKNQKYFKNNKGDSTDNSQAQKTETADFRASLATSGIPKFAMYD